MIRINVAAEYSSDKVNLLIIFMLSLCLWPLQVWIYIVDESKNKTSENKVPNYATPFIGLPTARLCIAKRSLPRACEPLLGDMRIRKEYGIR